MQARRAPLPDGAGALVKRPAHRRAMNAICCLRLVTWLALALAGSLSAQVQPTLVSDINVGPNTTRRDSNPSPGVVWNGSAYFFAASAGSGYELRRSDGTATGTTLVCDSMPEPNSRQGQNRSYEPVVFGNMLVFAGYDPAYGHELWTSDGTTGGTNMLVDLAPGELDGVDVSQGKSNLVVFGADLYFVGYDAAHGYELWRWDGVSSPSLFYEFTPGVQGSLLGAFHVAGNKLYFNVGSNLSVTDGTSTGTQVIGSVGISASNLAIPLGTGNLLVFTGRDDLLWRSDGTVTGTYQIPAAGALLYPGGLVAFGTEVYFSAWEAAVGNELWKTDGTNPPVLVADLSPGSASSSLSSLLPFGGHLYFLGITGSPGDLWRTDGTAAGTTLVHPGVITILGTVGGQMVVTLSIGGGGQTALGVSDGTSAGTFQIHNVFSYERAVAQLGTTLLYPGNSATGLELWRTDGTSAGTFLVKDINPDTVDSIPTALCGAGSTPHLFFTATSDSIAGVPGARPMWTTDGTAATTHPHSPYVLFGFGRSFTFFGPQLLIEAVSFSGRTLCRDDGVNTHGIWGAPIGQWQVYGSNVLLFGDVAMVDGGGQLIWSTDFQAGQVTSAANTAGPLGLTRVEDRLFFGAAGGLFVSDGMAAGTHLLSSVSVNPVGGPVAVGSRLFFVGNDSVHGDELWVSDGTQVGTHMVVDLTPGPARTFVYGAAAAGNILLFTADTPSAGLELWRSDGTAAGTFLLKDIVPGILGSGVTSLSQFGDKVLFLASDGVHGFEPWISDGTANGTAMVRDVNPGPTSSSTNLHYWTVPGSFWTVPGSGRALFTANDGTHGMEPWVTDGTSAGTRLLGDIWPGPEGSRTAEEWGEFALAGRQLYFAANDGVSGRELWTLPLYFPVARPYGDGCQGSSGRPQLDTDRPPQLGSTFQVQMQRAPATSLAALLVAFDPAYQPIAPWCHLLLANPVTVAFCTTDNSGRAAVPFSLPANPAFSQIQLFYQMAVLDPGGAGLGWNLSGGLEVVLDF